MSKPSTNLATLPSGFGEIERVSQSQGGAPYVQFISSKSRNYGDLLQRIPSLREGEPVLVQPAPAIPIKLSPFKFFLLNAIEFWAQYSQTGEMGDVSLTEPERGSEPRFDQTIESAVLVILEDRLVPASVRFKTTKCPAILPAMDAAEEAKTAAWGKKGSEYEFTLRCDKSWARFVTSALRVEKQNRMKGTTYASMEAQVNPTSAAEFQKLANFFSVPESVALLQEVATTYRKRVATAKAKELVVA